MKKDYGYSEYNDEKNTIPWKRIILILLMLITVVVIALFVIRGCGKSDLSKNLLEAGKEYYVKDSSSLPTEKGECNTLTLETLINENLILETKSHLIVTKKGRLVLNRIIEFLSN